MYIAINRFKINRGKENEFETLWRHRDSHLEDVTGFIKFHLAKGNSEPSHTLYISHSTWNSTEDFSRWTKSEAFRSAHKNAGKNSALYQEHPVFEGFTVVIGD